MNRKRLLPILLTIIALSVLLQGAIKAHGNTPPPWTVSLDALSTSPTDATIESSYNPHGFVSIGVIINASSSHPISNVYAWQFRIVYDSTSDQLANGSTDARASVSLGAQTGVGNPDWAGQLAGNNAILAAGVSSVDATHQQILVGFTLTGGNPGVTIGPGLSATVQGNLLASVNFTLTKTTTASFYLNPSDTTFLDSSPTHSPIPNINTGTSVTENQDNADFTFTSTPSSLTVPLGRSQTTTVTIASLNGFSGNVTLGITSPSPGPTTTLAPRTLQLGQGSSASSTLNITALGITGGNYTLTITANGLAPNGGTIAHSTTILVMVTSTSSGSSLLTILIASFIAIVAVVVAIAYLAKRRNPTSGKQPPQKSLRKNTPLPSPKRRSWENDNVNYHG